MAIGTGVFLIVVGAVLAFAVGDNLEAINLQLTGYIAMGAGVLAILISLVVNAQRTRTSHHQVVEHREDEPTV